MKKDKNIQELVDEFVHGLNFWDKHEKYYLEELIPGFVADISIGTPHERELLQKIKNELTDNEWNSLPELVLLRLSDEWQETEKEARDKELKAREKAAKEKKVKEERRIKEQKEKEARLKQEQEEMERAERERSEEEARKIIKAKKMKWLRQFSHLLQDDYISAISFLAEKDSNVVSDDEANKIIVHFVQQWVKKETGVKLDSQQSLAVGQAGCDVQVVARAGSGKTLTVVSRALFLQKHCKIPPNEILLVAFNKKAANEIETRMKSHLGELIPHIMTFHALAYSIVHPEENLLFDGPGNQGEGLSRVFQDVIDDCLRDEQFLQRIRSTMLSHFKGDWERIVRGGYELSGEQFKIYRQSLQRLTLNNEEVKSYGEKLIADYLFEHDVQYKYERNHWWGGINYRPDFTVFSTEDSGLIIEYFGMKGDPDYDEQIRQKRQYWASKDGWTLVEVYPKDIKEADYSDIESILNPCLLKIGYKCERLPEDTIWQRVKKRAVDSFTRTMRAFIGRCRKGDISPDELHIKCNSFSFKTTVEKNFVYLAIPIYRAYLERLESTGEEDFDGLLLRAAAMIKDNQTAFERKQSAGNLKDLKYIFIDEYQDFSELFLNLIRAIKTVNTSVECFCVGDDWQAINSFAGSDLRFYREFREFFPNGKTIDISSNYRSCEVVVELGNRLMKGFGKPALCASSEKGTALFCDLSLFSPNPIEESRHPGDVVTPALLRIINSHIESSEISILSRTNFIPWCVHGNKQYGRPNEVNSYVGVLRSFFPDQLKGNINTSTVHKYKGLESDVTIIVDANLRRFPLVHRDWFFSRILGESIDGILEEERRLFYVALTRAKSHVYIFSESQKYSPFFGFFKGYSDFRSINWSRFEHLPVHGETSYIVSVYNGTGSSYPTRMISDMLRAYGYNFKYDKNNSHWVKILQEVEYSVENITNEPWTRTANDVELLVHNDRNDLVCHYYIRDGKFINRLE
ncbi:UvrD-helicase domain-containing protein [Desulfocurvus vexinensis]|uniref:UvrD-helicase domain-containing protein n=1 Tax=Desulfocurvus vexinensis TaxID=399548 RepID=UPI0012EB54B3|nr:UvrD-helicase domain-containing protein [Desulfocurvus vexinensis]